jgi:hypothetical protein
MRLLFIFAIACSSASADPSPAVQIKNGKPGEFTLTASSTVELQTVASIEMLRDGKWIDISKGFDVGDGYRLIAGCGGKPDKCMTLAKGGSLSPVPWSGYSCSSQCNKTCDKNVQYGEGDYRLVVTSCDGKQTFTGPAFHMPKR